MGPRSRVPGASEPPAPGTFHSGEGSIRRSRLCRVYLGVCGLVLAVGAGFGCWGSGATAEPDGGAGKPIASKYCPGAEEPGPSGLTARELLRFGTVGDTDVMVVFCNPLTVQRLDRLVFFAGLDDHFGVPQSDVAAKSWVETSDGSRTEGGFAWEGDDLSAEEHHVGGLLTGPLTTSEGIELIKPNTNYVALHIEGIGSSGKSLILQWSQEHLR